MMRMGRELRVVGICALRGGHARFAEHDNCCTLLAVALEREIDTNQEGVALGTVYTACTIGTDKGVSRRV
jgi:hypothetical protein